MTLLMNYWQLGSFCLTLLSLPYWPEIPGMFWAGLIVIYYLTIILFRSPEIARLMLGISVGLIIAIIFGNRTLCESDRLYLSGQNTTINIKVDSSFTQNSFGFSGIAQIIRINDSPLPWYLQPKVKLYTPVKLDSGDTACFQVKIKPIYGQLNQAGMDSESYYFSQNVLARAFVIKGAAFYVQHRPNRRIRLQERISDVIAPLPHYDLIMALVFADRSGISEQQWQELKSSGLAHLIAISGLHISIAFTLGMLLFSLSGHCIQRGYWIHRFSGLLMAFCYSWLADFSLPTQRALIMLFAGFILMAVNIRLCYWQRMLLVMASVLAINPNAAINSSFWLSFIAVFCVSYVVFNDSGGTTLVEKALAWIKSHLLLTLLMMPLVAFLFGGFSLVAPFYNMVFIPWFGMVVIPLMFISLAVTLFSPSLSGPLWHMVDYALQPLDWLTPLSLDFWLTVPASWLYFTVVVIVILLLRHLLTVRWIMFIVLLGFISLTEEKRDSWKLDVLDVGQGLAVLIGKNEHYVLYDTGASWSGGSAVDFVVTPLLEKWGARKLDALILSHLDNDHAGGRTKVEHRWHPGLKLTSQKFNGYQPCTAGMHWQWQGLDFEVLWPPQATLSRNNQFSCVIKIVDPQYHHSVLLTGDIEAAAEMLLLKQDARMASDILLVPHHGSRSSSTQNLIDAVSPQWAFASLAKDNQWHLPAPEVKYRYLHSGAKWLDTGEAGQISVHFTNSQKMISSMRRADSLFSYPPWYRQMLRKQVE